MQTSNAHSRLKDLLALNAKKKKKKKYKILTQKKKQAQKQRRCKTNAYTKIQ